MSWQDIQKVGFSVKTWVEMERVVKFSGINMLEVKLESFAKHGYPLYSYNDGKFSPNVSNLASICQFADDHNLFLQFHLPIEREGSLASESGINVTFEAHHNIALARFMMLEEIYRSTGIAGSVITMHLPTIGYDGEDLIDEKSALEMTHKFFMRLDEIRIRKNHKMKIGLENATDPKKKAKTLGYLPSHFKSILKGTRTIGLTTDLGHRNLARNFTIREFWQLGIPFVNCHLHGNGSIFDADSFDDDEHNFATPLNVSGKQKGYKNWMDQFHRHRFPIVLEISHLERYSDEEIKAYLDNLQKNLA